MRSIERLLAVLSRLLIGVAGLCLAAMLLHVFGDVALKYLINRPIPGTAEVVARYYMVAAVFLPLPLVEIRNGGISVDLFYAMFGKRARRMLIGLAYVGQTIFFSLLAYQSFIDAMKSFARQEYIDGQIIVVVWPPTFCLPVGFALATLVSALRVVQILTRPDWEEVTDYKAAVEVDRPIQETI